MCHPVQIKKSRAARPIRQARARAVFSRGSGSCQVKWPDRSCQSDTQSHKRPTKREQLLLAWPPPSIALGVSLPLSPLQYQCHNNSTRQPILPLQGMFLTGVILPNRGCLHRAAESSIRDLNEASLGYAAILLPWVNHVPLTG